MRPSEFTLDRPPSMLSGERAIREKKETIMNVMQLIATMFAFYVLIGLVFAGWAFVR